jgi:hypothetical protein
VGGDADAATLERVLCMEPMLTKPIGSWTADDLDALVESKIPEGMRVDYKERLNSKARKDRIEICKDVSGLANAHGGWLFYGIAEDESPEPLPTEVTPFDLGGDLTAFEDILDSSLQPRARFEARSIDVKGGQVLLVRVEPREGALIMVQGYGEFRYYRRSGTRTIPMDQQEVARARAVDADRQGELMELLGPGLPLVARIGRFRTRELDELQLREKFALKPLVEKVEWIALPVVVAVAMDSPRPLIHHSVFAQDGPFPEPPGGRGRNRRVLPDPTWRITANGVVREQSIDPSARPPRLAHRLAVFREGVVEWARRYRNEDVIPAMTFAEDVHDVLRYVGSVFSSVDYFGRVAIFIRLENAHHAQLAFSSEGGFEEPHEPEREWIGHYAEAPVDDLITDPTPIVRDATDVISQGFGLRRSPCFSYQTGDWRD